MPLQDLPPDIPANTMGALPVARPTATPTPTPTPTPAGPLPGTVIPIFLPEGITAKEVAKDNADNAADMQTARNWLHRVISIFHPTAQTEPPLAHADRLVNRADQYEAQLDALQQKMKQRNPQ